MKKKTNHKYFRHVNYFYLIWCWNEDIIIILHFDIFNNNFAALFIPESIDLVIVIEWLSSL